MKISTKGKYAVEALVYMAYFSREIPLSVKTISEAIGTTQGYLEQIFFILKKENILSAVRGVKGGYLINQPLNKLTVGKVVRCVEKEIWPVPCVKDEAACNCGIQDICTTKHLWSKMSKLINETMDSITLEQLILGYRVWLIKQFGEVEYYL